MKKIFLMITIAISILGLAACNGGGKDGESIKSLVVYTNQTSGGRGGKLSTLIKKQGFPFSVVLVELSGQNLKNRLVAEKSAPIADVVLGGGAIEHLELKEEGILKPFIPTWIDMVEESQREVDGAFSPWAVEPLYLAFNKKHYTSDPTKVTGTIKLAPTSWGDLADNFKGKYNVFKPSSGTGATIYASILSQYLDEKGELGVSKEGWDLLSKLINNGEIDKGLWQSNLAGDTSPIAMSWAGAIFEIEKNFEVELDVVRPEAGVPIVVSQVAVVNSKNAARIKAAEQFINWWGQTGTQVEWSKISGQAPANFEALALVDEKVREINQAKALELDWTLIAKYASKWRQKIELDIIK